MEDEAYFGAISILIIHANLSIIKLIGKFKKKNE